MNKTYLKRRMKELGISKQDLADFLGLSIFTIDTYLRGTTPPKATLLAMCQKLKCSMNDLVYAEELKIMNGGKAVRTTA